MAELTGGCACGAVRWAHDGPFIRHLICHCRDCQRATSSPFAAFVGTRPEHVQWHGAPNHYQSSAQGVRGFCPDCGTRLYFRSQRWPGELHIHAGTLDDPSLYAPDTHVCVAEMVDWITLDDAVPKRDGFARTPANRCTQDKGETDA